MNDAAVDRPQAYAAGLGQFWLVTAASLVWNGYMAFDYLMFRLRNMDYIGAVMSDAAAALRWMENSPLWASLAWSIGIWGSLAGSLLLLMRSRHAVPAFLLALVATLVSTISQIMTIPAELNSVGANAMMIAVFVLVMFFWWYARRARTRGVLR